MIAQLRGGLLQRSGADKTKVTQLSTSWTDHDLDHIAAVMICYAGCEYVRVHIKPRKRVLDHGKSYGSHPAA